MKGLSAGLTFFNVSVVAAVLLGLAAHGLGPMTAYFSLVIGLVAAVIAYFATYDRPAESNQPPIWRRRYSSLVFWFVAGCFVIFAVRSFCWLLYIDGPEFRIQSVNNLGDLALHVTYIKTFANGIALWPDNPIYVFSKLRYPAGVDLFNGLLTILHVDLIKGLVWVGVLACLATFYAFYRWAGVFGIAAFLFNGGVMGFQFLHKWQFEFKDYQAEHIAWKSIPLAMFVTQRGLLYAIPAALLLLWHWREKFFRHESGAAVVAGGGDPGSALGEETTDTASATRVSQPHRGRLQSGPLPFWVEFTLYASLPLFHVHTFLALSIVLLFLFLFGDLPRRIHTGVLVGAALIPATFFVWLITDHFHARSMIKWQPGWVQSIGDFANPLGPEHSVAGGGILRQLDQIMEFWFLNLGFWIPVILVYLVVISARAWRARTPTAGASRIRVELVPLILTIVVLSLLAPFFKSWWYVVLLPIVAIPATAFALFKARNQRLPLDSSLTFTIAAVAIFLFAYLYKAAPWEWDNLKLLFWAYFLVLPFLWNDFIAQWPLPLRAITCIALFFSGFVSLFGGLSTPGFGFANRAELASVGVAVRKLPIEARFAAFPTYNHPLLLQGRKVVLGYPGHLWTQGFDYHEEEAKLGRLMRGEPDWRQAAEALRVRYIFWGREEQTNYPISKRPWEQALTNVGSSTCAIYDLQQPTKTP